MERCIVGTGTGWARSKERRGQMNLIVAILILILCCLGIRKILRENNQDRTFSNYVTMAVGAVMFMAILACPGSILKHFISSEDHPVLFAGIYLISTAAVLIVTFNVEKPNPQ